MKHKILLIEDEDSFFQAVKLMLKEHPVEIVWTQTAAKGIQAYRQNTQGFSTVIIDYVLPDLKGTEVCQALRKINPEQDFLFASGHEKMEYIMDVATTGSSGFLQKGRPAVELREKILLSLGRYESRNRILGFDDYEPSKAELDLRAYGIIGRSQAMHSMFKQIESAKKSPFPTLIVGETGTGKELVANALTPTGKNLVAVNCAGFIGRENMLESELFGYVKGAFTGAEKDTVGLVMQAHGNVLFLDELHQLPIGAQAKLLRFLQEMKFRKMGDNSGRETKVDFKLIAAVQPDIKERIKDGRFLPDLIERVSSLQISVPALRDRLDDIEPLVRSFQDTFNNGRADLDKKQVRISTVTELAKHPWPTNVRGLQNCIKRMLTNCSSDVVNPKDFKAYLENNLMYDPAEESIGVPLEEATARFETNTIIAALKTSRTRVEASARLGMPLTNFLRRLEKFEINPDLFLRRT